MRIARGDKSLRRLTVALSRGEVAVMACDTIYGFVGAVPETESKIRDIKGREETKPFLQLIADPDWLGRLGMQVPEGDFLKLWPGPFTFVLNGDDGTTTAFRVPEDERLRGLIAHVGTPLYSTSVNRAGDAPMDDPEKMDREFGTEVALVEDSGTYEGRSPSTVVDLTVRPYRILRQGSGIVPAGLLE